MIFLKKIGDFFLKCHFLEIFFRFERYLMKSHFCGTDFKIFSEYCEIYFLQKSWSWESCLRREVLGSGGANCLCKYLIITVVIIVIDAIFGIIVIVIVVIIWPTVCASISTSLFTILYLYILS